MFQRFTSILTMSMILVFSACERDDDAVVPVSPEKMVHIEGEVLHHSTPIPHARVFMKTGAIEFPGTDTAAYDLATSADENGRYEFTNLPTGQYYIFGTGYDSLIRDSVFGGIPAKIEGKTTTQKINVPVTE